MRDPIVGRHGGLDAGGSCCVMLGRRSKAGVPSAILATPPPLEKF